MGGTGADMMRAVAVAISPKRAPAVTGGTVERQWACRGSSRCGRLEGRVGQGADVVTVGNE
jgi:hypothetical protein